MTKRTIVIRRQSCQWQPKTKRNIKLIPEKRIHPAGFINPVVVVLVSTAFAGLFYVYSINQTAIKGIAIRNAEKEITERKKENESLKIKEAELKSLYRIEEVSKQLEMVGASSVKYIEETPAVAFNAVTKENKN